MNSPRDLRRRIKSISGTAQITKAMQMVAASKMRKAQQAALDARTFARMLYRMQRRATSRALAFSHPLLEARPVRRRAVILVAADKGLCGALNSNVFRLASHFDQQSTTSSLPDESPRSSSPGAGGTSPPSSPTVTRRHFPKRARSPRWRATCSSREKSTRFRSSPRGSSIR